MDRIVECCRSRESILAVYLFGSQASGRVGPSSDMDVAILLDQEGADDFPLLEFTASLQRRCRRPVDVVVLNRAGELLKYEVRRHGRLLYDRDPAKRKAFHVAGRKSFEDFLHLHRRYVRKVLYKDRE